MRTVRAPIDVRDEISVDEFYREYVNKKPLVMRGALAHLPAVSKWSFKYLRSLAPDLRVRLKEGDVAKGQTSTVTLAEYCDLVERLVEQDHHGVRFDPPPPYLHDLPLSSLIPELREDMEPFPVHMFPRFFRTDWWRFPQFFVGPPQTETPFHFDTLQTHNLFFQIHGEKRFVIVPAEDRSYSYTYNWRWSKVNADKPDYERYPLFRKARVHECRVSAGDLLYMPPGTLHQVFSLSSSISFNVDWHDRYSAVRGLTAVRAGMPLTNLRYNLVFALGVCAGIPNRLLMPALRAYFYYIS